MAFQVSPGVQVKEIDLTSLIPSVSTTRAGFAGRFNAGPVGSRVLITSVNQLRNVFGDPTDDNAVDWFSAANFLAYTNNLQIVRVIGSGSANASVAGGAGTIKTVADYDTQYGATGGATLGTTFGVFAARTPGGEIDKGGNALKVSVADRTSTDIRLYGLTFGASDALGGLSYPDASGATFTPTSETTSYFFHTEHQKFAGTGPEGGISSDTSGLPIGLPQNIANVDGLENGDNLRINGLVDPLRTITGFTAPIAFRITTSLTLGGGDGGGDGIDCITVDGASGGASDTTFASLVAGNFVYVQGHTAGLTFDAIGQITSFTQGSGATQTGIGITFNGGGIQSGKLMSVSAPLAGAGNILHVLGQIDVGGTAAGQSGLTAGSVEWKYTSNFSTQLPATSPDAEDRGASFDLVHVAVIDEDGAFGEKGAVIEKFDSVSKASNVKDVFGNSLYYKDRIRADSDFVFVTGHTDLPDFTGGVTGFIGEGFGTTANNGGSYGSAAVAGLRFRTLERAATNSLTGGTLAAPTSRITDGFDQFEDSETVDVNILVGGGITGADAIALANIADSRKDCIAFFSPPANAVLDSSEKSPLSSVKATANTVAYRKGTNAKKSGGDQDFTSANLNVDTSFAVIDSGWKLTFDRYNDTFRYIPLSADTAGVTVRTDIIAEPWFSPAGFNRGQVLGAVSLAYSPNQAERDELYTNSVNPVVSFPGQGTVLFGDKTMQKRPSAFDRINVRRLFIILEKAIATAAKFQLFEINDAFTRSQFKSLIDPFLRDVQARRGIVDFKVICDESNNTSSVVDRNEFVASIFIKPSRSINFITLNFVATGSGVNFQEIGA